MGVSKELYNHIKGKISYHQKLLDQNLAVENYMECAKHRDRIAELKIMLEPQEV